jgi:hypothetical protein
LVEIDLAGAGGDRSHLRFEPSRDVLLRRRKALKEFASAASMGRR